MTARPPPPPVHRSPRSRWSRLWIFVGIVLALPVAAIVGLSGIVTYGLGWSPYSTPGISMQPTFIVGDYFFIDRRAYRASLPKRGEIIAFYAPPALDFGASRTDGRGPEFVKRVIGLPGDHIEMTPAGPVINGVPAVQTRLGEYGGRSAPTRRPFLLQVRLPDGLTYEILKYSPNAPLDKGSYVVPAGMHFVLGDNRDDSIDSRSQLGRQVGWYVPMTEVIGRAAHIYWSGIDHLERIGHVPK